MPRTKGKQTSAVASSQTHLPSSGADGRRTGTAGPDGNKYSPPNGSASLAHNLMILVERDDGWLRIVRSADDDTLYIKWKYTRGQYSGYYVMARVQYWQLEYGIELLLDKLHAVYTGASRPTRDTPYNSD